MPKVSEQELSSDNLEFSWPPQSSTGAFSSDDRSNYSSCHHVFNSSNFNI
jgi:hypothetical protein